MKIIIVAIVVIIAVGVLGYALGWFGKKKANPLNLNTIQNAPSAPLNTGDVSPFSGLACDNWNRRPIAVMEAADVSVRPDSGFSDADLVLEMPAITASITQKVETAVLQKATQELLTLLASA